MSLSDAYRFGVGWTAAMLATAGQRALNVAAQKHSLSGTPGRVLNRHHVDVAETLRVLKPGGLFITQQVGDRNLGAICSTFGCGPGGEYRLGPEQSTLALAEAFKAQGAAILAFAEYDVPYLLLDVASLLFLLRGVGIPEDYDLERHWPQVLTSSRYAAQRSIEPTSTGVAIVAAPKIRGSNSLTPACGRVKC